MDKTSLFDVIARDDDAEQERIAGTRAISAVKVRVGHQFQAYLGLAKSPDDFAARVGLIRDRVGAIVDQTCSEYDASDRKAVLAAAVEQIHEAGGHKSDCGCGFCKNKGKLFDDEEDEGAEDEDAPPSSSMSTSEEREAAAKLACDCCEDCKEGKECNCGCSDCGSKKRSHMLSREAAATSMWMTAAEPVADGDSYTQERMSPTVSEGGEPAIDKGKVPKDGLKPIDVPSVAHPSVMQSVSESEGKRLEYGTGDPDPTGAVQTTVDAGKAMQPEHNVADHTDNWTGMAGQTDAVTSKWRIVGDDAHMTCPNCGQPNKVSTGDYQRDGKCAQCAALPPTTDDSGSSD